MDIQLATGIGGFTILGHCISSRGEVGEWYPSFIFLFYSFVSILIFNSCDVKAYGWKVIQDNRAMYRGNKVFK